MTAVTGSAGGDRSSPQGTPLVVALLALAFLVRLAFGVTSEFWRDDELQVFLIGLEFFTTGVWPLYGPDVVYTQTQIPGGLQGLLIGGPLWIVSQPEAPFVLLNLLSFGALCLLAWYIGKRVPGLPRWFLWPWVLFSPWTLNLSAHIYNPSYVLTGAVLFFVGAFEVVPALRRGSIPRGPAFFCLGFGLLWIYQLHLSALLLVPVAVVVVVLAAREDWRAVWRGLAWGGVGAAVAAGPLVPTVLHVGISGLANSAGANITTDPRNLLRLPEVTAQFFSLATFELGRFLGAHTNSRLAFLARFWWAAPFVIYAAVLGIAQAGTLIASLFWSRQNSRDWRAVKATIALLLALLCLSFAWSVRAPASHTFYLLLPVVMIYAAYCWEPLLRLRAVRIAAVLLLASGAVTHAAIGWRNFTSHSLYINRSAVVRAIVEKNHRLVGVRRPEIWKGTP